MQFRIPGAEVISTIQIHIPMAIVEVLFAIKDHAPPNCEYGIYLKGVLTDGIVHISTDYYIPNQTVSAGSISFDEEPPLNEFNVVIHRHPKGVDSFSGVDNTQLNDEFLASLIFQPSNGFHNPFPDSVVNVRLEDKRRLKVKPYVKIITNTVLNENVINVIKTKINPVKVAPQANLMLHNKRAVFSRRTHMDTDTPNLPESIFPFL